MLPRRSQLLLRRRTALSCLLRRSQRRWILWRRILLRRKRLLRSLSRRMTFRTALCLGEHGFGVVIRPLGRSWREQILWRSILRRRWRLSRRASLLGTLSRLSRRRSLQRRSAEAVAKEPPVEGALGEYLVEDGPPPLASLRPGEAFSGGDTGAAESSRALRTGMVDTDSENGKDNDFDARAEEELEEEGLSSIPEDFDVGDAVSTRTCPRLARRVASFVRPPFPTKPRGASRRIIVSDIDDDM